MSSKINGRNVSTKPVLKGIEATNLCWIRNKGKYGRKKGMNDSQILHMARYFKEKKFSSVSLSLWM